MRFATWPVSGAPVRMRRAFHGLRTEGAGAIRETAAVGLGVFVGCLPVYGFHLLLCWAIGSILGLNRLKLYLAANISNPLVAPWLVAAEIQAGAWVRRGSFQSLSPSAIKTAGMAVVGGDLLVGSLYVGAALAVVAAALTYATRWRSAGDRGFLELARRASDRYIDAGMTAWEDRKSTRLNSSH